MTQWIAKYYVACDGRMVVHTGDIIENTSSVGGTHCNITDDQGSKWANESQWLAANHSMSILLEADIPYTWNAGNHDGCLGPGLANATDDGWIGWDYAAFNPSIVQKASLDWSDAAWAGSDDQGTDTAVTFSAAGQNFLLANIQYNGVAELAWAQQLLANSSYRGYHVIIATHGFMDTFGEESDPNLWNFAQSLTCLTEGCKGQPGYPNVFLTLSGHFEGIYVTPAFHNTTASGVHELMFDREAQDVVRNESGEIEEMNGGATVTILTFNVGKGKIYVNTFDLGSPPPGKSYTPLTGPAYRFSLVQPFNFVQAASGSRRPTAETPARVLG